jgi:hypothetical protein
VITKRIAMTGACAIAAVVLNATDTRAQAVSSFTERPRVLELGQRAIVREDDGRVSRGNVVLLDDHRIAIQWRRWIFAKGERTLTSATVESIQVQDSEWNGSLAGAGVGFLVGWLLVDRQCGPDLCFSPVGRYLGTWIGFGVGGAIDRSINQTVYASSRGSRVSVVPLLGGNRAGVMVSKAW